MFQPIKKDEVHWYFSPLVFFGGSFLGSLFCLLVWFLGRVLLLFLVYMVKCCKYFKVYPWKW